MAHITKLGALAEELITAVSSITKDVSRYSQRWSNLAGFFQVQDTENL
jgi:hypothetical protein